MGCFDKLVKSHFIANASTELKLARQTIMSSSQSNFTSAFLFNKKERQLEYDNFIYQWYILEEIEASLNAQKTQEDINKLVFFLMIEDAIITYSLSKTELKLVEDYGFIINGDIPLCKSKHKIKKGMVVYTMINDKRFQFTPPTAN